MNNLCKALGVDHIIFVDFETYFSTDEGYDLKSISMTEYIRDPRFLVQGLGMKIDDGPVTWDRRFIYPVGTFAVVAHNVKFDGAILRWKYGIDPALWIDTKGMARAVLGHKVPNFSLKTLALYYGLEPKGELETDGLRTLGPEMESRLADYCKHDVELCYEIFKRLAVDFPLGQYDAMDWTIRAFVEPKLVIDIPKLERMVKDESTRREEAIRATGVEKSVLSSNKQFAMVVQKAGSAVPTKKSSRTGKTIPALSLSDEGFIALKTSNPVLYAGRVAAKSTIYETRGEKYINVGRTGELPFDVEYSGAVQTHRFSGGSGAGGNPQNIPKNSAFRDSITAPEGHTLVVGDFSQIELRILAYLAKERRLITQLENGADVYSEFASSVYGRKITKDDKQERFVGKCAVLGLGYGMGAKRFKHQVKVQGGVEITHEEAQRVVTLYRTHYRAIPALWDRLDAIIQIMTTRSPFYLTPFLRFEKESIVLPSGLKLRYNNLRWNTDEWVYDVYKRVHEAETVNLYGGKLTENICQALAGEICKTAIKRALHTGVNCVGQVHDEIIAVSDSPRDDIAALTDAMVMPLQWWSSIRLKADVHSGKTWQEAKQ